MSVGFAGTLARLQRAGSLGKIPFCPACGGGRAKKGFSRLAHQRATAHSLSHVAGRGVTFATLPKHERPPLPMKESTGTVHPTSRGLSWLLPRLIHLSDMGGQGMAGEAADSGI